MKTLFGILLAAIAVTLAGCETESSEQTALTISPNNVTLRVGESQEFVASGFRDYTWEIVSDLEPKPGVLSTTKGDRTVFTASTAGAPTIDGSGYWEPFAVTLRVSAIPLESTQNQPTNTQTGDEYLVSAEAIITIKPTDSTSYPPSSPRPDTNWVLNVRE